MIDIASQCFGKGSIYVVEKSFRLQKSKHLEKYPSLSLFRNPSQAEAKVSPLTL